MANIRSAEKDIRKTTVRTAHNQTVKSRIRTLRKKVIAALDKKGTEWDLVALTAPGEAACARGASITAAQAASSASAATAGTAATRSGRRGSLIGVLLKG